MIFASHPNFNAVINCIIGLLSLRDRKNAAVQTYILQMLPTLLSFEKGVNDIIKALELLVTDTFPSVSSRMKRGSTEAREYAMQLKELLITCVSAAKKNNPDIVVKVGK